MNMEYSYGKVDVSQGHICRRVGKNPCMWNQFDDLIDFIA